MQAFRVFIRLQQTFGVSVRPTMLYDIGAYKEQQNLFQNTFVIAGVEVPS